jgi:hypothetical protein
MELRVAYSVPATNFGVNQLSHNGAPELCKSRQLSLAVGIIWFALLCVLCTKFTKRIAGREIVHVQALLLDILHPNLLSRC